MHLEMIRGCIHDWLGVDNIRESEMTFEQKQNTFNKIIKILPQLDETWFNYFLQWFLEQYGEYECDEKPCEQCGDVTEKYSLDI